jgi:ABC-type maltose transport system permease subunit
VGVLALIGSWNEYLLPLVMINSETLYPWPLGIMQYQGQYGTDWGKVLAFVSLTLTPALIFYLSGSETYHCRADCRCRERMSVGRCGKLGRKLASAKIN